MAIMLGAVLCGTLSMRKCEENALMSHTHMDKRVCNQNPLPSSKWRIHPDVDTTNFQNMKPKHFFNVCCCE